MADEPFPELTREQVDALLLAQNARVLKLEKALQEIAAIEPVEGKASKNRGAMVHMQSIARAALPSADRRSV